MEKEYSHCLRCGRKLRNPEFKRRGYGDICWKKLQIRRVKSLFNLIPREK